MPAPRARRDASVPETDGRRLRRRRTEEALIDAVGSLLREGGVVAVGVNAVAERAGVEKVLVYRYFGGLDGLMTAYAKGSDFWPTLDELIGPSGEVLADPDRIRAGARVLANYATAIRRRPVTLDLLAHECVDRNALTIALESVREQRTTELYQALSKAGVPVDGPLGAIGAIFGAAINYLAVRGRRLRVFSGLGVHSDADWALIASTIELTFRAFEESGRTEPPPRAGPSKKKRARRP